MDWIEKLRGVVATNFHSHDWEVTTALANKIDTANSEDIVAS